VIVLLQPEISEMARGQEKVGGRQNITRFIPEVLLQYLTIKILNFSTITAIRILRF